MDDQFKVIDEVKRFIKYLDANGKYPNILKKYAFHLKVYYEYMKNIGINIKNLCNTENKGAVDILSESIMYLQYPDTFKVIK